MTNAPAVTPDRREPLPAHPHAAGAAVATRFGRAGTKAIRCSPGGVAKCGRSSMLKVWHRPTSTCLCPSEGQTSLLSRSARGSPRNMHRAPDRHGEQRGCRSQHKRRDRPQTPDECRLTSNGFYWRFAAARGRFGRTAMKYPACRLNLTELSPQANVRQKRGFDDAPGFTALRVAVPSA